MGPVSAVANSGQYLTTDIASHGIFTIRGKDGILRG